MRSKFPITLIAIIVLAIFLSGCAPTAGADGKVKAPSSKQTLEKVKGALSVIFVDLTTEKDKQSKSIFLRFFIFILLVAIIYGFMEREPHLRSLPRNSRIAIAIAISMMSAAALPTATLQGIGTINGVLIFSALTFGILFYTIMRVHEHLNQDTAMHYAGKAGVYGLATYLLGSVAASSGGPIDAAGAIVGWALYGTTQIANLGASVTLLVALYYIWKVFSCWSSDNTPTGNNMPGGRRSSSWFGGRSGTFHSSTAFADIENQIQQLIDNSTAGIANLTPAHGVPALGDATRQIENIRRIIPDKDHFMDPIVDLQMELDAHITALTDAALRARAARHKTRFDATLTTADAHADNIQGIANPTPDFPDVPALLAALQRIQTESRNLMRDWQNLNRNQTSIAAIN